MHAKLRARLRTFYLPWILGLVPIPAWADWALNMPEGVTPISQRIFDLHMLIIWICVIIGVVVFGVMIYSMVHHRKSKGAVAADFHENTKIEFVWTAIPMLILIGMAIPATTALIFMEKTEDAAVTIKATGYQWKWKYDYLNEGISFFSTLSTPREQLYDQAEKGEHYLLEVDNEVVVPVNTKVRILTTAADVIHAWWVPELGLKRDAIPGFVNDNWTYIEQPGVYRGQCAELCGKDHGFMPVVVRAVPMEEYQQWVAEKKAQQTAAVDGTEEPWDHQRLMAKGEEVYKASCVACHQVDGQGVPGTIPSLQGSAVATGPVNAHIDLVMRGKQDTPMQAFSEQLSDIELASVITYQRNAWDNKVGDLIQPATIKALR